jgi:hypothetical protein
MAKHSNNKPNDVLNKRYIVDREIGNKGNEGWIFLVNDTQDDLLEK